VVRVVQKDKRVFEGIMKSFEVGNGGLAVTLVMARDVSLLPVTASPDVCLHVPHVLSTHVGGGGVGGGGGASCGDVDLVVLLLAR
jgi:hypothetical protein